MTMLAAVYHGPRDLRIEERDIPAIGPDEMLLAVEAAGICATDLRIFEGSHRKFPPGTVRVPGHEIVGTVAKAGPGVRGFRPGQRVFVAPNIGCGHCGPCRAGRNSLCPNYDAFGITIDGAFAEFMRVVPAAIDQGNVIVLDSSVDAVGMTLAEPLACVLHCQDGVGLGPGDVVLIEGAGPMGMLHLLLARQRGARRVLVSDRSTARLAKAGALGADRVIDIDREDLASAVAEETAGQGADVVIVATAAAAALEASVHLAGAGGRVSFFAGLPSERPTIALNANLIHYKELIVTGTTACSTGDCRTAVRMVASGELDLRPLVGGEYALGEAVAAFDAARSGESLRIVLRPAGKAT